jgi:thiol:disulfide interchange protein DsbA
MRYLPRRLALIFAAMSAVLGAGTLSAAATAAPTPTAADEPYQLGKQYVLVNEQAPAADPTKVSVQEFFWYGCPHCYNLEPYLNGWVKKQPAYVAFEHLPNSLGRPIGELHARAFYIASVLGIEDKIRQPMFDGLRGVETGNKNLTTPDDIKALYVKIGGIKPGDYDSVAQSFSVDVAIKRSEKLAMSYRVTSTPTIVVDGKWMTDVAKAGGNEQLLKLMDYLVDKAKKERNLR